MEFLPSFTPEDTDVHVSVGRDSTFVLILVGGHLSCSPTLINGDKSWWPGQHGEGVRAWKPSQALLAPILCKFAEQNANDFAVLQDPGTSARRFAARSLPGLLAAAALEAKTGVQRGRVRTVGEGRAPPSVDTVPGISATTFLSPASPGFCVLRTGKGQHRQMLCPVLDGGILSQRCSMVTASIQTLGHPTHTDWAFIHCKAPNNNKK